MPPATAATPSGPVVHSGVTATTIPVAPAGTAAPTTAAAPAKPDRMVLLLAALLAVLVVAGIALFATRKAELWGGRSLPDPASIAVAASDTGDGQSAEVKASDVTAALKAKGFGARTEQVFSGKTEGSFVGYKGTQPGARMPKGAVITVQESAGPGVPKGVIGKQAEQVTSTFNTMGVPVHYKKVIVNDTKRMPEGSVVATYPAAGTGLPEDKRDEGIYIGVAGKGDGIGADIVGQDAADVRSELESQGYDVTVKRHFASENMVGKVIGADPAPGSPTTSGESITLYQGVDAGSVNDLMIDTSGRSQPGARTLYMMSDAITGTYCKATITDIDKDCMTLSAGENDYGDTTISQTWGSSAGSDSSDGTEVSQCFASNGGDVARCSIDITSDGQKYEGGSKNRLITKNWGMFDFGSGGEGAMCGGQMISTWFDGCRNGVPSARSESDGWDGSATYEMKANDLFVYVAAGADIKAAEEGGYFDADAVKAAGKQKAVDGDRTFILYRDPALYDQTSVKVTKENVGDNPFVPSTDDTNDVKFKPAASDATAYYLVDQTGDYDWDSMTNLSVKGAKDSDGSSGDSSSTAQGKSNTAADKVFKEAMKEAAEEYGFSSGAGGWGTSLTVHEDGTFEGTYIDTDLGGGGSEYPRGTRSQSEFSGKFVSAKKNDDGTYTLQCDTKGLKIKGTVGDSYDENGAKVTITEPYGMSPCGEFTLYPKGYAVSRLSDAMKGWGAGYFGSDRQASALPGPALVNETSGSGETFYSNLV
ncbi:PASTA domain-containing protein [Bifidobacterium callitrichidarum]|nr:PASTA domain-containing protein [Bifidobacterium callitrichidarum]